MATSLDVANWMVQTLVQNGKLKQVDAVSVIKQMFGNEFVYRNDAGGLSIQNAVLLEFRRLTLNSAVWIAEDKLWRKRVVADGEKRSALALRFQCSRCGRPLARLQSNWRTIQVGDEQTGDDQRTFRLCQECAEEIDTLQENTPPDYIGYRGYWIFEESLRYRDEDIPNVEYLVIDPKTRQEVDRCCDLQDARDSIDELMDFYSCYEDE